MCACFVFCFDKRLILSANILNLWVKIWDIEVSMGWVPH